MDLIESWSFKIFAFGTLGHPCGKQARSWDITAHWAETPRGCGKRMAAAEVAQDTNLTLVSSQLSSKPTADHRKDEFALCKQPSFPPCSAL